MKRAKRRLVRNGIILSNVAVLALVSVLVFGGNTHNANTVQSRASSSDEEVNPLDELSGADIAVHLSNRARLEETTAVVNNADSVNAQLAVVPSDSQVVAKPQIFSNTLKSKSDIVTHTAVSGDTIASLAQKYGVTSDSIRWSNGITGDRIQPNQTLLIPPVNGLVYKVKEGDTPASLASRYSANEQRIIAFNDAEIAGLKVGENIVIPNGTVPATITRVASPTTRNYAFGGPVALSYGGNGYDYGWCTWHAANRRIQNGQAMPRNFGNAISWYSIASRSGMAVGTEPRAGAILWHANMGGLGHVAYVEKDNGDGTFLVSDMNYPTWGRVTYRTITPAEFGRFRFIY